MSNTYTNHKGIKSALSTPPDNGQAEYKDTTATGLYLRVYSTGLGVFVHRYKIEGQRRVFTLPISELSKSSKESEVSAALTQARALHAQQRTQIKARNDPAIERDLKAHEINSMPTVLEFAHIYIERYAKPKKKSWPEDQRQLDSDVIPALGSLKLNLVTRSHITALLDRKQDTGAIVARNRLISLLSKFFSYALERGLINANPVTGVKRTKETSRERALTEDEIRQLWTVTEATGNFSPSVRLALRLILLTGQRPSEVAQMHESQINGNLWTMPDTKNGRAHTIPLSDMALAILDDARPHMRNGFLLPATNGQIMDKNILPKAMKRIQWANQANKPRPHDLRRTCITELSTLGFSRLVQDKVANHIDSTVGGIYDRYDYAKEKQQALDAWARKLSELIHGQSVGNILTFQRSA